MTTGLPDVIYNDFTRSIYMEYTIDQTYNDHSAPTTYRKAQSVIKNNITFDDNYRWRTKSTYDTVAWTIICEGTVISSPYFDYIFPNTTREIQMLLESNYPWNILDLHPAFYSGINPDDKEYFFVDELMILREENGLGEALFNKIGTSNITLSGKIYDSLIFELNMTITLSDG